MKLDALADELTLVSQGGKPARRVTQREIAAVARAAPMRAEAEARRSADAAEAATPANPPPPQGPQPGEVNAGPATPATATKPAPENAENTTQASTDGAEKEAPQKTPQQQQLDRRTKRDAIDAGLKSADESIEKARRLLELAGGALPLGGPE